MTGKTTLGCTATASSEYSGDYPAWKAFQRQYRTGTSAKSDWETTVADNDIHLQIELPEAKTLRKYDLYTGVFPGDNNQCIAVPTSWTVKGSNDGENFDTLHQITNYSGWDYSIYQQATFNVDNEKAYTFYRLNIDAWFDNSTSWNNFALGDWVLMGY
jgi:hypothetical protein